MSSNQAKWWMIGLSMLYAIWFILNLVYTDMLEGYRLSARQILFLISLPYVFAMWRLIKIGAKAWEKEQTDQQNKR